MKQTQNKAFTLVELIVVITILAVLATVAFISFQGYTSSSRDSVRLADLKNISKSFEFMKTKDQELPLPDQKVDITASGTIFQYQGVLEEQTLKLSNIHNGGLDPLTGNPYGYAVNAQRNKFQVIGFLENSQTAGNNLLSKSLADNTDKVIKTTGDNLGIILDETTKEIITLSGSLTQIDIETNTTDYTVVKSTDEITTGDNDFLYSQFEHVLKPNVSCKSILHNGQSTGNGIYTINPTGVNGEEFEVYCDMSTDGGGWAVIAMSFANANGDTSLPFNQDFATVRDVGVGSINNLEDNYFISMDNYSKLADKKSQKEYLWMARSRLSTDPWQETLRYNKHYITDEAGGFAWYGVHKNGGKVLYNNKFLSTFDQDRDDTPNNCAATYGSFGWYTSCHLAHYWSTTDEKSTCGSNEGDRFNNGGEHFCEESNSYGPDAVNAYNTWHSLKIMIR